MGVNGTDPLGLEVELRDIDKYEKIYHSIANADRYEREFDQIGKTIDAIERDARSGFYDDKQGQKAVDKQSLFNNMSSYIGIFSPDSSASDVMMMISGYYELYKQQNK